MGRYLSSNRLPALLKYQLGVKVYENEIKCPFCKTGNLDTMDDHALSGLVRGNLIAYHDRMRQNYVCLHEPRVADHL